jgi:hypothetical protein
MRWELFRADCRLCDRMENIIKSEFPLVNLEIHRASECKDGSCCKIAEKYNIKCVPTLVIDGKVICEGLPDENKLNEIRRIYYENYNPSCC